METRKFELPSEEDFVRWLKMEEEMEGVQFHVRRTYHSQRRKGQFCGELQFQRGLLEWNRMYRCGEDEKFRKSRRGRKRATPQSLSLQFDGLPLTPSALGKDRRRSAFSRFVRDFDGAAHYEKPDASYSRKKLDGNKFARSCPAYVKIVKTFHDPRIFVEYHSHHSHPTRNHNVSMECRDTSSYGGDVGNTADETSLARTGKSMMMASSASMMLTVRKKKKIETSSSSTSEEIVPRRRVSSDQKKRLFDCGVLTAKWKKKRKKGVTLKEEFNLCDVMHSDAGQGQSKVSFSDGVGGFRRSERYGAISSSSLFSPSASSTAASFSHSGKGCQFDMTRCVAFEKGMNIHQPSQMRSSSDVQDDGFPKKSNFVSKIDWDCEYDVDGVDVDDGEEEKVEEEEDSDRDGDEKECDCDAPKMDEDVSAWKNGRVCGPHEDDAEDWRGMRQSAMVIECKDKKVPPRSYAGVDVAKKHSSHPFGCLSRCVSSSDSTGGDMECDSDD